MIGLSGYELTFFGKKEIFFKQFSDVCQGFPVDLSPSEEESIRPVHLFVFLGILCSFPECI